MIAPETRFWIITDGKAGDVAQCFGVVERLGRFKPEQRIVRPRAPFSWFMPYSWKLPFGNIDPKEAPERQGSPIAPPFPDIAIASGRRAVTYLYTVKQASQGQTFTVFLKNPRIGSQAADFIWMPEHDNGAGDNVMKTLTSPHRLSQDKLKKARQHPPPWGETPTGKRLVAVLLGGNSKDFTFTHHDETCFVAGLEAAIAQGAHLIITPSRRTPERLAKAVARLVQAKGGWFWKGDCANPYLAMLAHADALVVTAESVNMVGEAVATGKGVYLFRPTGASHKIDRFLSMLNAQGAIRPFSPVLTRFTYAPIDSTPQIAAELARRYHLFCAMRPPE